MATNNVISIIVPVYNAEQYLTECLRSIENQSYNNYEVLLIDDGSTDSSQIICESFGNRDSRFKLYAQRNSGVSVARNKGIQLSTGGWLLFLDSDDLLLEDALYDLVKMTVESGCSLIQGGITTKLVNNVLRHDTHIYESEQLVKFLLNPYEYHNNTYYNKADLLHSTQGCYAKLISSNVVKKNNIWFDSNLKLGEDLVFYFDVLNQVEKVCVLPKKIYYYRLNNQSVTHKVNPNLYKYGLDFSAFFYDKVLKNDKYRSLYANDMSYQIYFHLRLVIDNYLWNALNPLSLKEFKQMIFEYTANKSVNAAMNTVQVKYCQINILRYQSIKSQLRVICLKKKYWVALYVLGKINNIVNALKRSRVFGLFS